MGLRILAILILLHATVAPALYARAAPAAPIVAVSSCCCVEPCNDCGCTIEAPPQTPPPAPTPPPQSRSHDELLRALALPGARVIEHIAREISAPSPPIAGTAHARPPVAFLGVAAQAALCVRTT